MGATVTTNKLAAAFQSATGKIFYILFEETYEKNCYPHTAKWSCHYIGSLEMAMKQIFLFASSCESGMLQNRNGSITPEGYIAGWLKELAAPMAFNDMTIDLKVGDGFYSPIHSGALEAVSQTLRVLGRQDIVDALRAGNSFSVSLYADAELVAALYDNATLSPWRLIGSSYAPINGLRRPDLGYSPTPAKSFNVHIPSFLKVDGNNRLIQRRDGTWYCGGWEYSIVAHHICCLWQDELREPASYRKRIKEYRDAIKAAPGIPENAKVVVDLTADLDDKYDREKIAKLPSEIPGTRTATRYEIAVTRNEDLLWKLTHLPEACTSWILPNRGMQPTNEQLDLLVT